MSELEIGDKVVRSSNPGRTYTVIGIRGDWVWVTSLGVTSLGLGGRGLILLGSEVEKIQQFFEKGKDYYFSLPAGGNQIFECKHVETRGRRPIAIGVCYLENSVQDSVNGVFLTDMKGWEEIDD